MLENWFKSVRNKYTMKELDKINFCNEKIEDIDISPLQKFAYWKAKRVIEKHEYAKENMQDLEERKSYLYEEI